MNIHCIRDIVIIVPEGTRQMACSNTTNYLQKILIVSCEMTVQAAHNYAKG